MPHITWSQLAADVTTCSSSIRTRYLLRRSEKQNVCPEIAHIGFYVSIP
jgi:hypothetical protein